MFASVDALLPSHDLMDVLAAENDLSIPSAQSSTRRGMRQAFPLHMNIGAIVCPACTKTFDREKTPFARPVSYYKLARNAIGDVSFSLAINIYLRSQCEVNIRHISAQCVCWAEIVHLRILIDDSDEFILISPRKHA
jgi:hypothetical protein